MKKLFALILSAALLLSVCSFAAAEAAGIPDAFAHITFDGEDEGYKAVTNGEKDGLSEEELAKLDGANKTIVEAPDAKFAYAPGPVGKSLFLDGTYGLDLGLKPTNTDVWTVSFWLNASRLSDYGPTLQIGYNMERADTAANVTWMNITQTNWTPKYFPTIWSRNVASNAEDGTVCWPWMAPFADDGAMIGKREWAMFTVVCSGEEQTGANGQKTVGAQLYVNGELRYDSADNYTNGTYFPYTWDATLAPNIMKPGEDAFEAFFGINFWDTIYKGYVDDLYVFDTALNAEQVKALYALGDGTLESSKDGPAEEEAAEPAAEAAWIKPVITGTAVGAEDLSSGFWSAHSAIWAAPKGEPASVTFTVYAPEEGSNWNSFVVVLQNTPEGHAADQAEGYKEYAVVRADNYGWGGGYEGNDALVLECNWDWDNFVRNINGAKVTVTVTNNGDKADVDIKATTADGKEFTQSYKNILVDGDVYFCLGVDSSCLDILETPAK